LNVLLVLLLIVFPSFLSNDDAHYIQKREKRNVQLAQNLILSFVQPSQLSGADLRSLPPQALTQ
jgi:hypothetical protein